MSRVATSCPRGVAAEDHHRGALRLLVPVVPPQAHVVAGARGPAGPRPRRNAVHAGLADLPLIDQPGAAFHYGHSTDLLGLLIARMEDAPLGDVLERRIFGPLGMKDTGFTVPRAKASRRAQLYGFDAMGQLMMRLTAAGGSTMAERPAEMAYVSGGQGLWSTLDD